MSSKLTKGFVVMDKDLQQFTSFNIFETEGEAQKFCDEYIGAHMFNSPFVARVVVKDVK